MLYRYVMGQHTPRWKWLMFFTIQAPMIAAERVGSKALQRRGIHVPAWLSIPLTLTTLMLTAHALFFSVWYETEFADILNISLNNDLQTIVSMFKT